MGDREADSGRPPLRIEFDTWPAGRRDQARIVEILPGDDLDAERVPSWNGSYGGPSHPSSMAWSVSSRARCSIAAIGSATPESINRRTEG